MSISRSRAGRLAAWVCAPCLTVATRGEQIAYYARTLNRQGRMHAT